MEFICKDCGFKTVVFIWKSAEKVVCSSCGGINTEFIIPGGTFENVVIAGYSSKSPEEKKKILKKRSHDHFKKHIEEQKNEMIKKTIQKNLI